MKYFLICFIVLTSMGKLLAQNYYEHVDRAFWVVNNTDASLDMWQSLGFSSFIDYGKINLKNQVFEEKKISLNANLLSSNLGGFHLTMINPEETNNAFTNYLKKNGEGAMALLFRIPDKDSYHAEIKRIREMEIEILQKGSIKLDKGTIEYTLFDTIEKGKFSLGLITGFDDLKDTNNQNKLGMKFTQYAFVINEYENVSAYWEQFGFPPFEIAYPVVHDKRYYEKEADFSMILGWQRHTDIAFEWTVPSVPPTVYADHIAKFGEGIQHFGYEVENIDESIQFMKDKGYKVSMSGGWGTKGQPGSGRFAYIDLEETGGESIELLWNYKQ